MNNYNNRTIPTPYLCEKDVYKPLMKKSALSYKIHNINKRPTIVSTPIQDFLLYRIIIKITKNKTKQKQPNHNNSIFLPSLMNDLLISFTTITKTSIPTPTRVYKNTAPFNFL